MLMWCATPIVVAGGQPSRLFNTSRYDLKSWSTSSRSLAFKVVRSIASSSFSGSFWRLFNVYSHSITLCGFITFSSSNICIVSSKGIRVLSACRAGSRTRASVRFNISIVTSCCFTIAVVHCRPKHAHGTIGCSDPHRRMYIRVCVRLHFTDETHIICSPSLSSSLRNGNTSPSPVSSVKQPPR